MMRKVFLIAWESLTEVIRHKVPSVHLIFVLIAVGLFNLFGHFETSPMLEYRMVQDVGLSVISLFGLLLTMFIGVSTLRDDLNRRTAYAVLTLPISRWEFYLGKLLGTLVAVILNIVIMVSIFAVLLYIKFGIIWNTFFWVVLFMTMEFTVIASLVLTFSLSDSTVLAFSFTVFLVILGNLTEHVRHLVSVAEIPALEKIVKTAYLFIPNFSYFNIKGQILKGFTLSTTLIVWALIYCTIYVFFVNLIAVKLIEKRDL